MPEHISAVTGMIEGFTHYEVHTEINSEGVHCEFCWRNIFPDYYSWLEKGFAKIE